MGSAEAAPMLVAIDDNAFQLRIVRAIAQANGFADIETCASAADGLAALERLSDRKIVLLCDLNMPDMDGVELIKALGKRKFPGVLVIVSGAAASVRASAANLAKAYGLDLRAALAKPVDPGEFGKLLVALRGG